ncbi:hypothetical protein K438DRAFT_1687174 [Mycena galopus ATCC 62051]|nr:hypothetical protein K438DRAFT_1687174 [Mycena galopus ATCC 62051]
MQALPATIFRGDGDQGINDGQSIIPELPVGFTAGEMLSPLSNYARHRPWTCHSLSRRFISRRWFMLAFVVIVVLAVGSTIAIGIPTLVVMGQHEPLAVRPVNGKPPRDGLFLYGGVRIWDMDNKVLSVRWVPHQCGTSFATPSPADCIGLQSDTLFFTDGDALGIPSFNQSNAVLNFDSDLQGFLRYGFEQVIEMNIEEATRSGQIDLSGLESDVLYPFDWYRVEFLIAALSLETNETVPMAGASIFNPDTSQWRLSTSYSYLHLPGQAAKLAVFVTIRRHVVVKISAFLILLINWLVALALLYMTVLSVFGRRKLPGGMDSVALPFAGLFALPSVRAVMPGNPPFGCLIDFIGILPNLAIIAGCASTLLLCRLRREAIVLVPFADERVSKLGGKERDSESDA